jgi:putative ABC transport system permease protein
MEALIQDVHFAIRSLRGSRGFAAVAILVLALGIGPNAALFSVVNAALWGWSDALEDPDRLVMVWKGRGDERWPTTPADFRDWREQSTVFTDLAAFHYQSVTLATGELPERALGVAVSPRLFRVVGVSPLLGRDFEDGEDVFGNHRVALVSHGLWKRTFGADPAAVGRSVRLNGEPFTVVGVMPPGAWFDVGAAELWMPLAYAPTDPRNHRNSHFLQTVARLRPGVSKDEAGAAMAAIAGRLALEYPENEDTTASVTTLRESALGEVEPRVALLLGAVGLVLLIACANVANLLLARGVARGRELALRRPRGAGRGRHVPQQHTQTQQH